jgi:CRISPR-associated endonuclease/helicase Cas3
VTEYFARPMNARGAQQTVVEHLKETAQRARENADKFGAGQIAYLAGLLHDFGKFGVLFQEVLRKRASHIDHAMPGAILALRLNQIPRSVRIDIAVAIAAHHGGLTSGDPYTVYKYREYYAPEKQRGAHDAPCHNGRELSIPDVTAFGTAMERLRGEIDFTQESASERAYSGKLERMLFQRMLLSALADADYASAAADDDPSYFDRAWDTPLDAKAALQKLTDHVNRLRTTSRADANVNQIRETLFKACLEGASMPPGLFTLTAPTGTGKTMALMAFALKHAARHGLKKVIVVLPYLSIIEQNAAEYRKILGEDTVLEVHSQSDIPEDMRLISERWSAPVIVTTSVRFFEMLFRRKPTDLRALHQIAGSVVVFDEAQSLPVPLARATLMAVNELIARYNCSVLFSTATQPAFDLLPSLPWHPQKLVANEQSLYDRMRRVRVEWRVDAPVPLEAVASEMAHCGNCCAILNLTAHAAKLCKLLLDQCEEGTVFHISARMCPAHRSQVILLIKERLKADLPCRLAATQAIEAGVDLDFDRMYRALAPLPSVIQAGGRCNRDGRLKEGVMVVFKPEEANLYPPDPAYGNGANALKELLLEGDVDIHSLDDMRRYDERMFGDELHEKRALWDAIELQDFELVSDAYHLIDSAGVNILVPYEDPVHEGLFSVLRSEALEKGIDDGWMRRARPLTVTAFLREEQIRRDYPFLMRLRYRPARGKRMEIDSNWYVLNDPKAYDPFIGFAPERGSLEFTI